MKFVHILLQKGNVSTLHWDTVGVIRFQLGLVQKQNETYDIDLDALPEQPDGINY